MRNFLRPLSIVLLSLILAAMPVLIGVRVERLPDNSDLTVGHGEYTITIGTVSASTTADYTADGVADDSQFQTALNALPATGGKISVLAGTYVFSAAVTRAIDNVIIEGVGRATYLTRNGADPIFTAGGNNWQFINLRTDAGGITTGATTGWAYRNVTIGATYYTLASQADIDVGSIELRAQTFESDVATGTAPFTVASTTVTTNLNADLLDGSHASAFISATNSQAPVMVAATDATTAEKTAALASGGTVCDGVNDQTDIHAAIDVALGGIVQLTSGTFTCTQLIIDDGTVIGNGNIGDLDYVTRIVVTSDPGVWIQEGGRLWGVTVTTAAGYIGHAVEIGGDNQYFEEVPKIYDDLVIRGGDYTNGAGMYIYVHNTAVDPDDAGFVFSSFGTLNVVGYALPFNIYVDDTNKGAKMCYIGGCRFGQIFLYGGTTQIALIESVSEAPIAGNSFEGFQLQPNGASTGDGLVVTGSVSTSSIYNNDFGYVMPWDWSTPTGDQLVTNAYTAQCKVTGYFDTDNLDLSGKYWVITNLNQAVPKTLTISGGAVTIIPGINYYYIAGEGGVADNLDTINGEKLVPPGTIITISCADSADDITVRHSADNIVLDVAANAVLGNIWDTISLINTGNDNRLWKEIGRGISGT